MGKINGKHLWGKFMGKIYGEFLWHFLLYFFAVLAAWHSCPGLAAMAIAVILTLQFILGPLLFILHPHSVSLELIFG